METLCVCFFLLDVSLSLVIFLYNHQHQQHNHHHHHHHGPTVHIYCCDKVMQMRLWTSWKCKFIIIIIFIAITIYRYECFSIVWPMRCVFFSFFHSLVGWFDVVDPEDERTTKCEWTWIAGPAGAHMPSLRKSTFWPIKISVMREQIILFLIHASVRDHMWSLPHRNDTDILLQLELIHLSASKWRWFRMKIRAWLMLADMRVMRANKSKTPVSLTFRCVCQSMWQQFCFFFSLLFIWNSSQLIVSFCMQWTQCARKMIDQNNVDEQNYDRRLMRWQAEERWPQIDQAMQYVRFLHALNEDLLEWQHANEIEMSLWDDDEVIADDCIHWASMQIYRTLTQRASMILKLKAKLHTQLLSAHEGKCRISTTPFLPSSRTTQ